jgi:hypothetical protein
MLQVRVRTLKMPEREEDRAIAPMAVLVRTTDSLRDLRAVLVAHAAAPVEPDSDSDEEDHDDTAACKSREMAREAARAAALPDPALTWVAGNNFDFVVSDVKVKRKQVCPLTAAVCNDAGLSAVFASMSLDRDLFQYFQSICTHQQLHAKRCVRESREWHRSVMGGWGARNGQ